MKPSETKQTDYGELAMDPTATVYYIHAYRDIQHSGGYEPAAVQQANRAIMNKNGQFVLTGSATQDTKARRHSGAGRFSVLKMRPMSWFERGWSTGEVSLQSLVETGDPRSSDADFSIPGLCDRIALGGWPGLIGEKHPCMQSPPTPLAAMTPWMTTRPAHTCRHWNA